MRIGNIICPSLSVNYVQTITRMCKQWILGPSSLGRSGLGMRRVGSELPVFYGLFAVLIHAVTIVSLNSQAPPQPCVAYCAKNGESLDDFITCSVTYNAWF